MEDFQSGMVNDCVSFASHIRGAGRLVSGGGRLHVVGHSMGGLVAVHAVAKAPAIFDGRLVLSCPMLETVWGDVPPGLPRAVSEAVSGFGCALGGRRSLCPAPGGRLCWWDPHAPVEGVRLTHDPGFLKWFWALRSKNPRMALTGPSMGWIVEMIGAQKALPGLAPAVAAPTLVLTAEFDDLVKECGHEAFVRLAPRARRLVVAGSFHEPLFEAAPIRAAATRAVVGWLLCGRSQTPAPRHEEPPNGAPELPGKFLKPPLRCVQASPGSDPAPSPVVAGAEAQVEAGGRGRAVTAAAVVALALGGLAAWVLLGSRAAEGGAGTSGSSSGGLGKKAAALAAVGGLVGRKRRGH